MGDFNKMMKKIEQDNSVPKSVWDKYVQTLEGLPEKNSKTKKYNWGGKIAAAAACIITAGSLICFTNPTLASKIPVLGGIFKQVEKTTTYSGNYSENADVLVSDENGNTAEASYYAEDAGVKVSASEVLYDGVSVFLTLKVDVEEGNLLNIPKNKAAGAANEGSSIMYLWGQYEIPGVFPEESLTEDSFYLDGKALDEHTFVGMVKMDADKDELQNGTLALNLSAIGYDDITELDREDISASHRMEGSWKLQVPFKLDTAQTKRLAFDTKDKEYGLKKVTVSPYQIVTEISVPYTEREVTHEEYEEAMEIKTGGSEEHPLSYEKYAEMEGKKYAENHTLIYDQNGEEITPRGSRDNGKSVFAVKGAKISKLQVLVFDSLEFLDADGGDTSKLTDKLRKAAVSYEVVELE